jgi:hypothetical protein
MGWTIGVLGFDSRRGLGIFLFTTGSRTALGSTQPPIQWVPVALSPAVKRPGREADHSPPSSAEVKEWVELYLHSPNTPSWRSAQSKHRDTFTFTNNAHWENPGICYNRHEALQQVYTQFCNEQNINILLMWADRYLANTLQIKFRNNMALTLWRLVSALSTEVVIKLMHEFPSRNWVALVEFPSTVTSRHTLLWGNWPLRVLSHLLLVTIETIQSYQVMNSLLDKTKLIESTTFNKTMIPNCRTWGVHLDLPYTTSSPSCKLLIC